MNVDTPVLVSFVFPLSTLNLSAAQGQKYFLRISMRSF